VPRALAAAARASARALLIFSVARKTTAPMPRTVTSAYICRFQLPDLGQLVSASSEPRDDVASVSGTAKSRVACDAIVKCAGHKDVGGGYHALLPQMEWTAIRMMVIEACRTAAAQGRKGCAVGSLPQGRDATRFPAPRKNYHLRIKQRVRGYAL
jgi:hypothetical protein